MNRIPVSVLDQRQRLAEFLRRCSKNLLLDPGMQAHGALIKEGFEYDLMLSNDLIDMYGKCGEMDAACTVFDKMPERNVVSWTSLMCGHILNGDASKSLFLFSQMRLSGIKPNEFTFSTNFKTCSMLNRPDIGMQVHGYSLKTGNDVVIVVANSAIDMYAKCGRINEAARMFVFMMVKDLISWNSMIAGYSIAGLRERAIVLFREMLEDGQEPDEFTLTITFKACTDLGAVREGSQIHAFLVANGFPYLIKTSVAGALIDHYVKCGKLCQARRVFSQVEEKNVISCSSIILGYAHEGNLAEAMDLFRQLRVSDIKIDDFILSGMIGVFADLALVEQGKQMHALATKLPSGSELSVCNSIVDMYLKCGLVDEAHKFFTEMSTRDRISWTVMITGYGKHGLGKQAVRLFNKMQSDNFEPDDVTYLAVLLACSHSGLVEDGQKCFSKLCNDQRIRTRIEHYACMVDLLGRAGRLKEARNIIDTMPLKPDIGIWQTLLSSCRMNRAVELGREVGEILLRIDGNNPVNYVMLSNIYADAGYWNECERIRELVNTKRLKKDAGRSWVEIDKKVHFFYGGDDKHPLIEKIHEVLKEMETRMKQELGYVCRVKYALHDVEEESKEENLRVHSEKLAVGLALVCGGWEGSGRVIRVFKNLRICVDCHEFMKGLSKMLEVVFVVRDANRFHKFENGLCSCRDYW